MGRKKNRDESVSCYYCEKQFDSEDHLIQHQKSKHFKCPICYRRFVVSFFFYECVFNC